jgi:hypothetical protein
MEFEWDEAKMPRRCATAVSALTMALGFSPGRFYLGGYPPRVRRGSPGVGDHGDILHVVHVARMRAHHLGSASQ